MKYVLTGSAGNVTRPLAGQLLDAGHEVSIIGRNASHLKPLTDRGAHALVGSVEDVDFLVKAFKGADAVYTMVPPKFDIQSGWKQYIGNIVKQYADAIKANGIRYVVNLSSVGADLPDGCGPVSGLYIGEQALNQLKDVNVLHLRAGYFFQNLLANLGMVKNMHIIGGNFGGPGAKMVIADPDDIAEVAFKALDGLKFNGHSVRYVASDERTTSEIAAVLGKAIGQPDLPWVLFSDEQALAGILQSGIPEEVARNYVEMGAAMRSGIMFADYWKHRPSQLGKTKLEDFAEIFAALYEKA